MSGILSPKMVSFSCADLDFLGKRRERLSKSRSCRRDHPSGAFFLWRCRPRLRAVKSRARPTFYCAKSRTTSPKEERARWMISATTPGFREAFAALPKEVQVRARKAYHLWRQNPRHPSLHFKKIGKVWS